AWCVLLVLAVLEVAVLLAPQALQLHPLQQGVAFKQASGYTMLGLLAFAMGFGWLRRRPALARHQAALHSAHQLAGLVLLVLLAAHLGQAPAGFLLATFHAWG